MVASTLAKKLHRIGLLLSAIALLELAIPKSAQAYDWNTNNNPAVWSAPNQPSHPIAPPFPPSMPGFSQLNPILPDRSENNWFYFTNVPSTRFSDPPTTYGFQYLIKGDSLFTKILDFPIGIDGDNFFTVSSGNTILGQFSPGQSVDFVALLGGGVSEFTITGIDSLIAPKSPTAFPIRLAFDTPEASFKMQAFDEPERKSVPEATSVLGILMFGAFGVGLQLKRKLNKSDASNLHKL